MEEKYNLAQEKVKKYNQEQLLSNYDRLDDNLKEELLDSILDTDFDMVDELYKDVNNHVVGSNVQIDPIGFVDKEKLSIEEYNKYKELGEELIKNGEYAVVTMAGGQRNKTWTYWTKGNL